MARFIPAALVLLTLPAFGQQEKPPRILFSFDATPATKIIEVIAKISGSNIVVSPNLEGSITMRLQNVPWREALTRVVDAVDGGIIEEGRVIRVLSAKEMAEAVTRTFERIMLCGV